MDHTPTRRVLGHLDTNRGLISPVNTLHSPAKKMLGTSVLSPVRQQLYASSMARTPMLKRKLDYIYTQPANQVEKRQRHEGQAARMMDQENIQYRNEGDLESSQDSHDQSYSQSSIFDSTLNDSQNTTMTELDPDVLNFVETSYTPQHNHYSAHTLAYPSRRPSSEQIATTAEELRLRLRLLMYKIRTNQIHTPLADLAVVSPSTIRASEEPQ